MTDFIHEEYSTMYIRDILKVDQDDLITMMSSTESGLAYWADGVLFACFAMSESEEVAKRELAGTIYMEKVVFAKYEKFSKTIKSTTNFEIPVVNVQNSGMYKKLIEWIKCQPIWNDG